MFEIIAFVLDVISRSFASSFSSYVSSRFVAVIFEISESTFDDARIACEIEVDCLPLTFY